MEQKTENATAPQPQQTMSGHIHSDGVVEQTAAPSSPQKRRIAIALLLVGAVCAGLGQTIVFSVLPPLAREIGLSNFQVGVIFMISALCWVLLGPRWGRLSDQRGRKLFIVVGMFGFSLSMALFGASIWLGVAGVISGLPLYFLMILSRSLYGILGSAGPSATQAYIADRTSRADRTAGIAGFAAAFGFGAMLGPSFGAAISLINPVAPFFAAAALGGIMGLAVFFYLPERTGPLSRKPSSVKVRLTDPRLTPFFAFALLFGSINAIPIQTIAFYFIDRLGFSTTQATGYVSIGLTLSALASLAAQLIVVQRLRVPPATLMRLAPILMVAGQGIIWMNATLWPVVLGMAISGFGSGMAMPAATGASSIAVGPNEQGGAIALTSSFVGAGFIISPPFGFALYAIAPQTPYIFTTVLAGALLIFAWTSRTVGGAVPSYNENITDEAIKKPAASPYQ